MRRIRHLEQCEYIIPIGQKIPQALALSGQSNCYLERTWDQKFDLVPNVFASFNSGLMNGIKVICHLSKNSVPFSSKINSVNLFRVSDGSWSTVFVSSKVPTQSGLTWECYFSQTDLGLNELSGAETYLIEVLFYRKRKKFMKKVYFNHLGCFDSINRLRQESEKQLILGAIE